MKTHRVRIFLPLAACLSAALLIMRPDAALLGAREGLERFYTLILPALLPFFICADLLRQSGLLFAAGKALDRPMRVLFRLGGECGAAYLIGAVSGYPAGARLAGQLYAEGRLSLDETERLCLFSNLCGPLFVSGAVAVGILGDTRLAAPLIIAHQLGAWFVAIVHARLFPGNSNPTSSTQASKMIMRDKQSSLAFGTLMGNSAYDAMLVMLKVCAITVFFTVLLRVFGSLGIIRLLSDLFAQLLSIFNLPPSLGESLVTGLFEMTAACQLVAGTRSTLLLQSAFCAAFFTFGGLSVVMQTLAFAPVRASRFMIAKLVHSVFSALLTHLLLPLFAGDARDVIAIQQTNPAWQTDLLTVLGLMLISTLTIGIIALTSKMIQARRKS